MPILSLPSGITFCPYEAIFLDPIRHEIDSLNLEPSLFFACLGARHPLCQISNILCPWLRCPSALPAPVQAQLLELTAHVVAMCGEGLSGVMHFEAMYDPRKQVGIASGPLQVRITIQVFWGVISCLKAETYWYLRSIVLY